MKLVIATFNKDKLKELKELLKLKKEVELIPLCDFERASPPEETGLTFRENAVIKAEYAYHLTGLPSLGDDSGLEVDYLNGRPGIYSSRFAGDDASYDANNKKLIECLKNVSSDRRGAQFRCVTAFCAGPERVHIEEGICRGFITEAPAGKGGFGYDPYFFCPEFGKTFAELSNAQKNTVSHRGEAMRKMAAYLHGYPREMQ